MTTQTRRLTALAGCLFGLALPSPALGAAVQARSADDVVSSMGFNTHTTYSNSAYANFSQVEAKLGELGARHLREGLQLNRPDQYERLAELGEQGTKATLIFDPRFGTVDALLGVLDRNAELRRAVGAIEGPNEYDLVGTSGWATTVRDYQRRLYQGVRARSSLSGVPVIGPSFGRSGNQSVVGDLSGYLDYGNIHSYPGGRQPSAGLYDAMNSARVVSGYKPLVSTETGYHDAVNDTSGHAPASERAFQAYMPALLMTYFAQGVRRAYSYELVNQYANPSLNMRDRNFGLLKSDWKPKRAFERVRTLYQLMRDPGPPLAPRSFSYSIAGGDPQLRQVLLHKRNGAFYLALWRDVSVWDQVRRVELYPADVTSTVVLEQPVSSAALFRVERGTSAVESYTSPTRISIPLSAHVAVLKLVPR